MIYSWTGGSDPVLRRNCVLLAMVDELCESLEVNDHNVLRAGGLQHKEAVEGEAPKLLRRKTVSYAVGHMGRLDRTMVNERLSGGGRRVWRSGWVITGARCGVQSKRLAGVLEIGRNWVGLE